VCRRDERRGVNEETTSSQLLEMSLFNDFISEMELEDLNVLGRRFMWYHSNGRSMSRIDRVLISEEWFQRWGENLFGFFQEMSRIIVCWCLKMVGGFGGQSLFVLIIFGFKTGTLNGWWRRLGEIKR